MKYNLLTSILVLCLSISSCSKNEAELDCIPIGYNQVFNLMIDKIYCLPDGNEITAKTINNEYCPCNAICIWQGEANLDMVYNINGIEESYLFHGETHLNDTTLVIPSIFNFVLHEVYFEVACTDDLPSPNIESVDFEITTQ